MLKFIFAPMNSGKSDRAIEYVRKYRENGYKVLLAKSALDNRDSVNEVVSRKGGREECEIIYENTNIIDMVRDYKEFPIETLVIDEAQFLSKEQVDQCRDVSYTYNIPVICIGLRSNFRGELFEGSKRLFELSDEIDEIENICWCKNKALINARLDEDGNIVRNGDEISIGHNYKALCYKHFVENKASRESCFTEDKEKLENIKF